MKLFLWTFLSLMTLFPKIIIGQNYKKIADKYFEVANYSKAILNYDSIIDIQSDRAALIKRGKSKYYIGNLDGAIEDLSIAYKLPNQQKDNTILYFVGLAYLAKSDYVEAAKFLKTYLNTLKPSDGDWHETIDLIKVCGYSIDNTYNNQIAYIENLGPTINSEFDDFAPHFSPTQLGKIYYSSARSNSIGGLRDNDGLEDNIFGKYSADMYTSVINNGNWQNPTTFQPLLNSPKSDVIQHISTDGNIIYFSKFLTETNNILYTDTFSNYRELSSPLTAPKLPYNGNEGDKDLFVFNDSLLFFSSNRQGGFGGYDIYYSIKINGIWNEAINLGPQINSPWNEISSFCTRGGKHFYFSSDRPTSFGGYDLFKASIQNNGKWNGIINLGIPINSPKDDIDFELSLDGATAFFASNRQDGYGGFDIYSIYFKDQDIDQISYTDIPLFINMSDSANTPIVHLGQKIVPAKGKSIEFYSKPLYYQTEEDVTSPANVSLAKKVTDILAIYPNAKIMLTAHSDAEVRLENTLYFSIKRSEKIAQLIMDNGISPDRIILQGCGDNFPLAKPLINGIPSSLALKSNNRIDISLFCDQCDGLSFIPNYPEVADIYKDEKWEHFSRYNNGISFKVKFVEASQMLKAEIVTQSKNIVIEKKLNESQYTYLLGQTNSYLEAKSLKNILIREGFTEVVVVAYLNGFPINENQLNQYAKTYKELLELISDRQ